MVTYSASSLRSCCWSSSGSQRSLKSKTRHTLAGGLWQSSVSLSAEVPGEADVALLTGLLLFLWLQMGKCGVFIPSHSHQVIPVPILMKISLAIPIPTGFRWDPWEFPIHDSSLQQLSRCVLAAHIVNGVSQSIDLCLVQTHVSSTSIAITTTRKRS